MKEALSSSETSVLTRATRRDIPENAILHSHRRENLKSYIRSYKLLLPESLYDIFDSPHDQKPKHLAVVAKIPALKYTYCNETLKS
jgi:hypothetical protein